VSQFDFYEWEHFLWSSQSKINVRGSFKRPWFRSSRFRYRHWPHAIANTDTHTERDTAVFTVSDGNSAGQKTFFLIYPIQLFWLPIQLFWLGPFLLNVNLTFII